MNIRIGSKEDILLIKDLAYKTWWPTYEKILSPEQISFMLEKMYSEEALKEQFDNNYCFYIARRTGRDVGFASISCTEPEHKIYKLHKIYVLPMEQGKGTGRELITHVEEEVRKAGGRILELNVNRNNPALGFYRSIGFEIFKEEDIPFFEYYMNDYVMRKTLQT